MKTVNQRILFGLTGLLLIPVGLLAQASTSANSSADNNDKDKTILLDPFEVRTSSDTGFAATTTALTRFNVDLNKLPATADIMDKQFMDDVSVTTIEDLFKGYAAGGGFVLGTPETDSNSNQPGDYAGSGQFSIRGLTASSAKRNGFSAPSTTYNTTTSFDIEEVDVLRGSQGLLYGASGAGGVVNTVTKLARFNSHTAEVTERVDQYGSKRTVFDAGLGQRNFALRLSAITSSERYHRLFINDSLEGYYGQIAVKLPFHTTLRISGEENHDNRIVPSTTNGTNAVRLNATGQPSDPRNGYTLGYLVFSGDWAANDPVTGAAFPRGQILNYPLTVENFQSIAGWRSAHATNTMLSDATLDTVWAPWFSTQIGVAESRWQSWRVVNGFQGIFAPPVNGVAVSGNPLPGWSAEYSSNVNTGDTLEQTRYKGFRASGLLTNDFWGKRVHSQTGFGFDRTYQDNGRVDYGYYLADSGGNLIYNYGATGTNVGRTPVPAYWWDISNGLLAHPFGKPFSGAIYVNGQEYIRSPQNMTNPSWVSANNPNGLESLARDANGNLIYKLGSGNNNNSRGLTQQSRNQGWYIANYTEWFGDRLGTLLGVRESTTFQRRPNGTASFPQAFIEQRSRTLPSYNAGFNFRITSWLRGYYAFSETFNSPNGANDPLGISPANTTGKTHEAGLKFTTLDGRISGSFAAFQAVSTNEQFNIGSTLLNDINPSGLNGSFNGPAGGRNSWVVIDKISRGLELILAAQPKPNWKMRLVASISDGTIRTTKDYPMLYNDQFSVDAKGNVTYTNGQPFLVPTDAASVTKVSTLNTTVNPATAYPTATFQQLTLDMINNPGSPYYVWANQATQTVNGQIPSTTVLYHALANFNNGGTTALTGVTGLPISAIQYNWANPNNYPGFITTAKKGQATVGYPLFMVSYTTKYDFTQGWLRGFSVGGSLNLSWDNHTYYYRTPDQNFHLWSAPTESPQVNALVSYRHKFRRTTFRSQVNINNVFNRYEFALAPNNGAGWTPTTVAATVYGQPRMYVWTNSFSF